MVLKSFRFLKRKSCIWLQEKERVERIKAYDTTEKQKVISFGRKKKSAVVFHSDMLEDSACVKVIGIPMSATADKLIKFVKSVATPKAVEIVKHNSGTKSFAFLLFNTSRDATKVIEFFCGEMIEGHTVLLKKVRQRTDRKNMTCETQVAAAGMMGRGVSAEKKERVDKTPKNACYDTHGDELKPKMTDLHPSNSSDSSIHGFLYHETEHEASAAVGHSSVTLAHEKVPQDIEDKPEKNASYSENTKDLHTNSHETYYNPFYFSTKPLDKVLQVYNKTSKDASEVLLALKSANVRYSDLRTANNKVYVGFNVWTDALRAQNCMINYGIELRAAESYPQQQVQVQVVHAINNPSIIGGGGRGQGGTGTGTGTAKIRPDRRLQHKLGNSMNRQPNPNTTPQPNKQHKLQPRTGTGTGGNKQETGEAYPSLPSANTTQEQSTKQVQITETTQVQNTGAAVDNNTHIVNTNSNMITQDSGMTTVPVNLVAPASAPASASAPVPVIGAAQPIKYFFVDWNNGEMHPKQQ